MSAPSWQGYVPPQPAQMPPNGQVPSTGPPDPRLYIRELETALRQLAEMNDERLNGDPVQTLLLPGVVGKAYGKWENAAADRLHAGAEARRVQDEVPERPGSALAAFLASTPAAPECVIPGLVPVASRVIVTGEEGAGKSTLNRFIAMHHAAGVQPFTGQPYDGGTAVLLDCENPVGLQQMRLAELRETLSADAAARADERLVLDAQPGGIDLAAPYWQEYVMRLAAGHGASLAVIGPGSGRVRVRPRRLRLYLPQMVLYNP